MIPPDVASSLRLILPDQQAATNAQTLPVVAAQKIADVLSNLVPGQRILAEIQALLPNGNYRAIVAQRDVTLALPFSAKAGDSIELEVTESDGKLTLAFVANKTENAVTKASQESVPTTFSSAGKLISDLMSGIDGGGKRAPAAPLNGNQALIESMPKNAADFAPVLKQAVTQSGVFYEAHQARWVAGQLPTEALRQEPQAKFSPAPIPFLANAFVDENSLDSSKTNLSGVNILASLPIKETSPGNIQADQALPSTSKEQTALPPRTQDAKPEQVLLPVRNETSSPQQASVSSHPSGNSMPQQLTPLVQQQLDGLASQNFAWQGQVWPGQQMWWEIGENPENARNLNGEPLAQWQTRLKLSLPILGGIEAKLQLRPGGEVGISLTTDSESSEATLRDGISQLRHQFESAGLNLTQLLVQHGQAAE